MPISGNVFGLDTKLVIRLTPDWFWRHAVKRQTQTRARAPLLDIPLCDTTGGGPTMTWKSAGPGEPWHRFSMLRA